MGNWEEGGGKDEDCSVVILAMAFAESWVRKSEAMEALIGLAEGN